MALYHNNQNGTFTDVTRAAGLAKSIYGQGVAVGSVGGDAVVEALELAASDAQHLAGEVGRHDPRARAAFRDGGR